MTFLSGIVSECILGYHSTIVWPRRYKYFDYHSTILCNIPSGIFARTKQHYMYNTRTTSVITQRTWITTKTSKGQSYIDELFFGYTQFLWHVFFFGVLLWIYDNNFIDVTLLRWICILCSTNRYRWTTNLGDIWDVLHSIQSNKKKYGQHKLDFEVLDN